MITKVNYLRMYDGKMTACPILLNAKVTKGPPRKFIVFGVIEDNGEQYLVFRDTLLEKNYIERIRYTNGPNVYDAPVLEYIEDDQLWQTLVNYAIAEKMLPNEFENKKLIITPGGSQNVSF